MSPRALLRKAGMAALVAFAAMAATPVVVIGSSLFSEVNYSDPLIKQDPVTFMNDTAVGIAFGLQGLVVAAAVACLVVCIRRFLGTGLSSDLMLCAGAVPMVCWAIYGGATAQAYSSALQGNIVQVQGDAAVRAMVGYSNMSITQGLMGGAGVALAVWALLLHVSSGVRGLTGRLYAALVAGITALSLAATALGLGAMATLLSMPLMVVVALTLLQRSRKAAVCAEAAQHAM